MGLSLGVVFQNLDPSRGGAETYVGDLCRRLIARGHSVELIAERWSTTAVPEGVRCRSVPVEGRTRRARIWGFGTRAEALLRERGADYDCTVGFINTWGHDVLIPQGGVHAASLESNAARFTPGWRRGLYIASKRLNPKQTLYREIERRQYDPARSTRVVAVSDMVRGHLKRFHGVPDDRIRVIPNAIDADRLHVADPARVRAEFRDAHGLAPDEIVVLFVAHNFRLKGLADLMAALKHLRMRRPDARPIRLLVCGGGRAAPFRAKARRLGLDDSVKILGFVSDVRHAFHASDAFALPTYYDPCSLVVFEALASGLPVITTACNGAGELIALGREGYVIPSPKDHEALADALDSLRDDEARQTMSRHATALGQAQTLDRHVSSLVELFEEVAAEKRHGRSPSHAPASRPHTEIAGLARW